MHTIPKQESQVDRWYKKDGNCRSSASETEKERGVGGGGGGGGRNCAKREVKALLECSRQRMGINHLTVDPLVRSY